MRCINRAQYITMTRFTGILFPAISLIAVVFGAPTTYDKRQDGNLNVAAKLENIMIVIALPSKALARTNVDNSELASYLALLNDQSHPGQNQYDVIADAANADANEPSKVEQAIPAHDEDDEIGLSSDEEDSKDGVQQPQKSSGDLKTDAKSSASRSGARTLWSHVEDVVDNRQGGSLKKELSWSKDRDAVLPADDQSRSSDHNEVGLIPDHHLTLLGSAIEDCGPDRRRNSYGICQAFPAE